LMASDKMEIMQTRTTRFKMIILEVGYGL
jgi:hypothetical protein